MTDALSRAESSTDTFHDALCQKSTKKTSTQASLTIWVELPKLKVIDEELKDVIFHRTNGCPESKKERKTARTQAY